MSTAVPAPARSSWPARRKNAVISYVSFLAEAMELSDWHISINFDTQAGDDAYAEVVPHSNQRRVEMRFGQNFDVLDLQGVRQTLVHELMHCHLFAPHHLAEELITASSGKRSSRLGLIALDASVEQSTDAIAEFVAKLFPLPDRSVLPAPSRRQGPTPPLVLAPRVAVKSRRSRPR